MILKLMKNCESDESIDSQNENITEESDVVAVMERFVMTSSLDTTLYCMRIIEFLMKE